MRVFTDRIEDGDLDHDGDEWLGKRTVNGHAVSYPLDPTRWWPHAGELDDKPDETGGRSGCPLLTPLFCKYILILLLSRAVHFFQMFGHRVQYLAEGKGSNSGSTSAQGRRQNNVRIQGIDVAVAGD